MNKDHLGILETHLKELKKSDNSKDTNNLILASVIKLLKNINSTDAVLSEYTKLELRLCFSEFGKIAGEVCAFYQNSKDHLDPVALNGEIGKKLEDSTSKLKTITAEIDTMEKNNVLLLEAEDKLNKKQSEFTALGKKISSLKSIYETVTDEKITELSENAECLNKKIIENKAKTADMESIIEKYKKLFADLSDTYVKINDEKKAVEENIVDKIIERHDEIKKICDDKNMLLDKYINDINYYKEFYTELEKTLREIEEPHNIYSRHFDENSNIVKKMKEYNISPGEVCRLDEIMENELRRFDDMIKAIITEQEKAKDDIVRLQNTGGVSH